MQNPRTEQRREFIINILYYATVALLVFLCLNYVAKWLMPFIVGFVIAFSVNPWVNGICKVTKINRKLCAVIVLVLEYALIVLLIWGLGAKIISSIREVFADLPGYYDNSIAPFLTNLNTSLADLAARISPETLAQIYSMLESTLDNIRSFILSISSRMVSILANTTTRIPFFFISFVFAILSSIFISMNYGGVVTFIRNQLPQKTANFLSDAKKHLGKTALGYLRAYLIIWVLTFAELSIGLSILKIDNAIGIAAIIAFADVFPVIGTGGILIPWAIFSLITQNYFVGIGLVIVYLVVIVVRNFAEPKIVGDQLGLNPLVTLIAIYLGYLWLGFPGMIILPITVTILVGLHNSGKIKLWKE